MILRAPCIPLITHDPYFSVWSATDNLYDSDTIHWTGAPHPIKGIVTVDGKDYRFMGSGNENTLTQTDVDIAALTTVYTFEGAGIKLTATFLSPLFPDRLEILSRPVTCLKLAYESLDGSDHTVTAVITVGEEICVDVKGKIKTTAETISFGKINAAKIGSIDQAVLNRSGDNVRIDWGYFYLAAENSEVSFKTEKKEDSEETYLCLKKVLKDSALIAFAYDDIYSIEYFGDRLKSVWNKDGKTIEEAIADTLSDFDTLLEDAGKLDDKLYFDSVKAGGEKYSDLLRLAFRQVIAAHKAVIDKDGNLLFFSKECFSNGCAATVDVSYPSIPMFLIYNPELVLGMMKPVIKFARSQAWNYDFAPHDVGQYPLVNGQVYGRNDDGTFKFERQMPVEECGNMIIMAAAYTIASGDTSFVKENFDLLEKWVKYLCDNGTDPDNQLCTDDFAGHLAHNCNLSLKAISGIIGMSIICKLVGFEAEAVKYLDKAREISIKWLLRASNGDGSYRLAFDKKGTFSMKYNIVWDKLFGTRLIPKEVFEGETWANRRHFEKYGMPLDNRKAYTKSDWLVWTATLCESKADFESYIEPMWLAYNCSPSRVPLTDWYDTKTSVAEHFRNRTVQGGLFMKLLEYYKIMKI